MNNTAIESTPPRHPASYIRFDRGTIVLSDDAWRMVLQSSNNDSSDAAKKLGIIRDSRTGDLRAPAFRYREIRAALGIISRENAGFPGLGTEPPLRDYQSYALEAWHRHGQRGVISLPTGAGKSLCGLAAIIRCRVPSLILVPTRILMQQWVDMLTSHLCTDIGIIGDNQFELRLITVCTYESAYRHMRRIGNRFGLLIVDEAHHFGRGKKDEALEMSIAPSRLGLSATLPEDADKLAELERLVGPVVAEIATSELIGSHLCPYQILQVPIRLCPEELKEYQRLRALYRSYFKSNFNRDQSFAKSLSRAMQDASGQGRTALLAWRRSRDMIRMPDCKLDQLQTLMASMRKKQGIIFTERSQDVYRISAALRVPAVTAEISRKERGQLLTHFSNGTIRWLATCKVLNEGYDLPRAEVAIMTEPPANQVDFRQRLGRVLRKHPDKEISTVLQLYCPATHEQGRLKQLLRSAHP